MPALNGQRKLIRWASDFTWEKPLEQLRREESVESTPARQL